MGVVHGKGLYFALNDVGAVLRNLSTYLRNVTGIPIQESPVSDATTAGRDTSTGVRGIRSGSGSFDGLFDSLATSGPDVVLFALSKNDAATAFEYGPEGNTTGKVKYIGLLRITKYVISSPYDNVVAFTSDFTIDGDTSRSTFA